ncbi:MAG TPA: TolC family protein [Polyangiaceae bacterium]|nr:TolC family protein [Polyangiaceae bacterium]
MKPQRHAFPRPLFVASLLGLVTAACARDQESLTSIKSSADARLRDSRTPPPRDESAERLLASPLTADSATRAALLNNARVRAAYEELGIARASVVDALRLPNPELDAAIRFSKEKPEIELLAMLGLGELLFLPLRAGAANAELDATRTEVVGLIVSLAFDVRAAFYQYQAALQTLELTRTVLRAIEASADAAGHLHDAGNITDLDLATERAFAEEARVATRRADTEAAEARARLANLLGVTDAGSTWTAAGRLADPPREELALDALEGRALQQSLELQATHQHADAAAQRATAEKTERWVPGLKAGVSARDEGHWAVGPAVSVQLPLFYQGRGKIDAALGEERRQKALGAASAIDVRNAAHAAATKLTAARENALRYRDVLLPLRQRVLEETELHYNAMTIGVFQLLAAKRDQIATARTYVELLRDYWLARNEVQRMLAGGGVR